MVKLSRSEIASAVEKLGGWTVANGKLHRDYKFADFVHAFGFMATAALMIEKMGHHPEWCNVYNRLSVDLTTHDAGGITKKDIALAKKLETLAAKLVSGGATLADRPGPDRQCSSAATGPTLSCCDASRHYTTPPALSWRSEWSL